MGGDHGAVVVIPAALRVLHKYPALKLILVGDQSVLTTELQRCGGMSGARLSIHHASQTVEMDEPPSQALRNKKDSSMRVALNLVKEGQAQAAVSAGNTGALMATARFVLKTLPGIDRPAIISALPTMRGQTHMLDLGANIDSTPEHLFQFAVMGSVLTSAMENIARPRVGLLNIGEEEIKGNETVKEAARLLAASDLHYVGFIEGDAIYRGEVDVVVCDGFVGNVALKSSEGVAKMINSFLRKEFQANLVTKISAWMARSAWRAFKHRFDPRQYNGASFVGLQGIVVKSHGGADVAAFANAIKVAILEVEKGVPARISAHLEAFLAQRQQVAAG